MSINFNSRLLTIMFCVIILFSSIGLFTLWNFNSELNRVINEQNGKLSNLKTTILNLNYTLMTYQTIVKELNHTVAVDDHIQRSYRNLFFSNITPPITKPDAVRIALSYGNWTQETLSGKPITATLKWIVVERVEGGPIYVFESIIEVTQPSSDYSPKQEGSHVFRYAWQVVVAFTKPSDVEYWVDASTGEVFTSPAFFYPK